MKFFGAGTFNVLNNVLSQVFHIVNFVPTRLFQAYISPRIYIKVIFWFWI